MRFIKLSFVILIFLNVGLNAQDGSDIKYIRIDDVDTSYIGKDIHIDFYNRSFATKKRDSVFILVNDSLILFVEHREDDGFNNWFSRQYLEELKSTGDEKLRLIKSVIKEITRDSILITNHFAVFKGRNILPGRSFVQDNWFNKSIITTILVHSEQCCK